MYLGTRQSSHCNCCHLLRRRKVEISWVDPYEGEEEFLSHHALLVEHSLESTHREGGAEMVRLLRGFA